MRSLTLAPSFWIKELQCSTEAGGWKQSWGRLEKGESKREEVRTRLRTALGGNTEIMGQRFANSGEKWCKGACYYSKMQSVGACLGTKGKKLGSQRVKTGESVLHIRPLWLRPQEARGRLSVVPPSCSELGMSSLGGCVGPHQVLAQAASPYLEILGVLNHLSHV